MAGEKGLCSRSVPALARQRRSAFASAHPLRMADRLVAVLAYTDKVALPVSVCICIPDVQRPFRCVLDMVDVMDQVGAPVSTALLADLALVLVHVQHLMRQPHPLRRAVERMHIAGCNQTLKPY